MFKRTQFLKSELKNKIKEVLPKHLEMIKEVKTKHGEKVIGEVKVNQILGGMRGINGLFYDSSKLDHEKGIMLRGRNLFDLVDLLKYEKSDEPIPEALLWLLFSDSLPNHKETKSVIDEIKDRANTCKFDNTEKL